MTHYDSFRSILRAVASNNPVANLVSWDFLDSPFYSSFYVHSEMALDNQGRGDAMRIGLRGGRAIKIVHGWSSTINRQVPEVQTKWVNILMIKSTRYTPEVRTKWIELQQNGEYSYIWLRKLLRWLIGKFSWWNEDKNQTNCGPSYWRNPETGLELHPLTIGPMECLLLKTWKPRLLLELVCSYFYPCCDGKFCSVHWEITADFHRDCWWLLL